MTTVDVTYAPQVTGGGEEMSMTAPSRCKERRKGWEESGKER